MLDLVRRLERRTLFGSPRASARPRRWALRGLAAAFGVWLVYLFVFSDQGIIRILSMRRELARLERHSRFLAGRVKLVDEQLQRVRTDPFYTEKYVRENTGMVRPDEIVYRVVPESVAQEAVRAKARQAQSAAEKKGGGAAPAGTAKTGAAPGGTAPRPPGAAAGAPAKAAPARLGPALPGPAEPQSRQGHRGA